MASEASEAVTITVRFTPDGEPEVWTDPPELADWITVAALYRAAEGLDLFAVEDTEEPEEDE